MALIISFTLILALFCAPALASTRHTEQPTIKSWCVSGREYSRQIGRRMEPRRRMVRDAWRRYCATLDRGVCYGRWGAEVGELQRRADRDKDGGSTGNVGGAVALLEDTMRRWVAFVKRALCGPVQLPGVL
jgi:hypothetical protein